MKIKNKKKRLPLYIKTVLALFVLLCGGGIWQNAMLKKETRMFPPAGGLYNVHSHDMHLYGAGEGNTTIVLIPGSGTPNAFTDYYGLHSELRNYTRVVTYDRAGYGWSESTELPRTIDAIVDELHELLEEAEEAAPYLLVGHSLASLEVIRFAQKYPEEVEGIVLLDGGSPEYYAEDEEIKALLINRGIAGLRATGITRALGNAGILLRFSGENLRYGELPDEIKKVDLSMYYNRIGASDNLAFIRLMNENAQAVLDGGHLEDIPLRILSSDVGKAWQDVQQQQLMRWSSDSQQKTLANSSHYIHWSNRDEVIQIILEALEDEK